ncbi:uncharacterized protein [Antedon mediterranea]|uniref:uncharacterized protein n=1 Tax=Antedon mediterranea TaxID=105859 RepID=UPI003AF46DEF
MSHSRQALLAFNICAKPGLPLALFHHVCSLGLYRGKRTRRGIRAQRRLVNKSLQVSIPVVDNKHCDNSNLVKIQLQPRNNSRIQQPVNFAAWNARSIKPKTASVCDFIITKKLDIFAITESWLTNDDRSNRAIADIKNTLPDFELLHRSRNHSTGGGVCVILRKGFLATANSGPIFKSFEYIDITITAKSSSCRLYIIYRPPYSRNNKITTKMFFSDFSTLLELINNVPGRVLLAGDFNLHMDDVQNSDAITMKNLLSISGFTQHVTGPTHKSGHTLDLLICRDTDELITDISIHTDQPSDHYPTMCHLSISRPDSTRHRISFRKLRQIDIKSFKNDIVKSELITNPAAGIDTLVAQYNNVLSHLLDLHAPIVTRSIILRPHAPWYNENLRKQKRVKRRCERKWASSGLEVHKQLYHSECNTYKQLLEKSKTDFHRCQVSKCEQGKLFNLIDNLTSANHKQILPLHESSDDMACQFSEFFRDKIHKVKIDSRMTLTVSVVS